MEDLEHRHVTTDEGQALADEYEIRFFETSAKQDLNVEDAFVAIAQDVKNRLMADGLSNSPSAGHKLAQAGAAPAAKRSCC